MMHGRGRPWVRVPVHSASIEPLIDISISVSPRQTRREHQLQQLVQRAPLRRGTRQAYHRALVTNGRYDEALRHARQWAEVDGSHPDALLALADMQAATGRALPAMRTYSATVEVQPWNVNLHQDLARMYRNKGDVRRSCAHLWSVMSLYPRRLEHHLALATCLGQLPEERPRAMQLLSELTRGSGKRDAARIGRALAQLVSGEATRRSDPDRGALLIRATWDRPVDLDVGLITPRGRRLSALRTGRQGQASDSRDGQTAEVLALRWIGNGRYRIEITPANGETMTGTVSGTLLVKARGKTRAIPFVLSGGSGAGKPVAWLDLSTRYAMRPY